DYRVPQISPGPAVVPCPCPAGYRRRAGAAAPSDEAAAVVVQAPVAAAPVLVPPRALLLALACLFLLLALRGSPDPDPVVFPSTDLSRSAATCTSPLLRQGNILAPVLSSTTKV
uniref:Uncharacterized protein n=1 Tax=Oryza meridionalis TaxID=40149 RepID=A0A0E0ES31_9ORYZ